MESWNWDTETESGLEHLVGGMGGAGKGGVVDKKWGEKKRCEEKT